MEKPDSGSAPTAKESMAKSDSGSALTAKESMAKTVSSSKLTFKESGITSVHYAEQSTQMNFSVHSMHSRENFIPTPSKTVTRSSFSGSSSFLFPVRRDSLRGIPLTYSYLSTKVNLKDTPMNDQNTTLNSYLKSTKYDQEFWVIRDKVYKDLEVDISRHPSYTIKNISYNLECELLYMEAKQKYDAQLTREMEYFISSKPKTYDQFFTRSLLSYTTLWPPLHTKRELDIFIKTFFQLPPKDKKRLNYLMKTDLSSI